MPPPTEVDDHVDVVYQPARARSPLDHAILVFTETATWYSFSTAAPVEAFSEGAPKPSDSSRSGCEALRKRDGAGRGPRARADTGPPLRLSCLRLTARWLPVPGQTLESE